MAGFFLGRSGWPLRDPGPILNTAVFPGSVHECGRKFRGGSEEVEGILQRWSENIKR